MNVNGGMGVCIVHGVHTLAGLLLSICSYNVVGLALLLSRFLREGERDIPWDDYRPAFVFVVADADVIINSIAYPVRMSSMLFLIWSLLHSVCSCWGRECIE